MDSITNLMQKFYDQFPYTNLAINQGRINGGYFLNYSHIYYQLNGVFRRTERINILDAGCGAGDTTAILALNNKGAKIKAIDLSKKALQKAQDLIKRFNIPNVEFRQADILELNIKEEFDFILSAGVIHHLADPGKGLKKLAGLLKPDGVMLLFLYSMYGRWDIGIMQEILNLLEKDGSKFEERIYIIKTLLKSLPPDNRLVKFYNSSPLNQEGSYFTDMYINPNEQRYNINTLFELLGNAGLKLISFLDEPFWQPDKHFQDKSILEKVNRLSRQEQLHLIELLCPDIMGYTFFCLRKEFKQNIRRYTDKELPHIYPLINPAAFILDDTTVNVGGKTISPAFNNIKLIPEFSGRKTIGTICRDLSFDGPLNSPFLMFMNNLEQAGAVMFLEKPLSEY